MRLRDRRAILSALVLLCAYISGLALLALSAFDRAPVFAPWEIALFWVCTALMLWRLLVRAAFVTRTYGLAEGIASLPRVLVSNLIAIAAARRALATYIGLARGAPLVWDKTDHVFPTAMPAE